MKAVVWCLSLECPLISELVPLESVSWDKDRYELSCSKSTHEDGSILKMNIVVHTFNANTWWQRQGDDYEFKASMIPVSTTTTTTECTLIEYTEFVWCIGLRNLLSYARFSYMWKSTLPVDASGFLFCFFLCVCVFFFLIFLFCRFSFLFVFDWGNSKIIAFSRSFASLSWMKGVSKTWSMYCMAEGPNLWLQSP